MLPRSIVPRRKSTCSPFYHLTSIGYFLALQRFSFLLLRRGKPKCAYLWNRRREVWTCSLLPICRGLLYSWAVFLRTICLRCFWAWYSPSVLSQTTTWYTIFLSSDHSPSGISPWRQPCTFSSIHSIDSSFLPLHLLNFCSFSPCSWVFVRGWYFLPCISKAADREFLWIALPVSLS